MSRRARVPAALLLLTLALPATASAQRTWLAGDLHVHTCFSGDVYCGPADEPFALQPDDDPLNLAQEGGEYVAEHGPEAYTFGLPTSARFAEAAARELDFLAITDHNDVRSAKDPGFGSAGVIGVPGYENSVQGHAQVLGSDALLPNGDGGVAAMQQLVAALHARGGAFQVNHPGYVQSSPFTTCAAAERGKDAPLHWKYGYAVAPDTIEVWNPTTLTQSNEAYLECWLQRGGRVGLTAGSDSHWTSIVAVQGAGNPTTWVLADARSRPAVLAALRAGRTSLSKAPPAQGGRPLLLESDANRDGRFASAVGADVPPGAPMRVRLDGGATGGLVTVRANGGDLVAERPLPPGGAVTFTAPARGWMRANLLSAPRGSGQAPGCQPVGQPASSCPYDQAMLGMTSPAYVRVPAPPGGRGGPRARPRRRLRVRIVSGRARGRRVRLRVRCSEACTLRAEARTRKDRPGRTTRRLRAGRTTTVSLRLRRRPTGRFTVVVAARARDGRRAWAKRRFYRSRR